MEVVSKILSTIVASEYILLLLTLFFQVCKLSVPNSNNMPHYFGNRDSSDSDYLTCAAQIYQSYVQNEKGSTEFFLVSNEVDQEEVKSYFQSRLLETRTTLTSQFVLRNENVEDFMARIYSSNDNHALVSFIQVENLNQLHQLLEKIGRLESAQMSPTNFQLAYSPTFFIMWKNNSWSQFEEILKFNKKNQKLPGLSSRVYFILPERKNGSGSDLEESTSSCSCSIYEFYSFPYSSSNNDSRRQESRINHIPTSDLIGNIAKTRTNLIGLSLRAGGVGAVNQYGYGLSSGRKNYVTSNLVATGISEQVLKHLQDYFGFDVQIIATSSWIEPPINGSWTGIGKLLTQGGIDISIDQSLFLPFRAAYFTSLVPTFDEDSVNIYFRQPPVSSVRNVFVLPFAMNVWAVLAGTFILGLALVPLIKWIIIDLCASHFNTLFSNEVELFASSYVLWLISFFTNQGWFQQPKQSFLRIIFLVGSFLGLILYTAYTANLVSVFTNPEKPIKNVDEFVASDLHIYAPGASTISKLVFMGSVKSGSSNPDHPQEKPIQFFTDPSAIFRGLAASRRAPSSENCYGILGFAYWFYTQIRFHVPNVTESCLCDEINEIQPWYGSFKAGMILPKNSAFKEIFNNRIINLYESGLISREQSYFMSTYKPFCGYEFLKKKTFNPDENGLSVADIWSALVIISVGCCTALVALIFELAWSKLNK